MRWPWERDPQLEREAIGAQRLIAERLAESGALTSMAIEQAARALEQLKPPAPGTLKLGEKLFGCPKCHSTLPAASVLVLRSWVERDGVLVSIPTGERIACQAPNCTHQYSLHAGGSWQHSPSAEPLTAVPPQPTSAVEPPAAEPPPGNPPAWPMTRGKPAGF